MTKAMYIQRNAHVNLLYGTDNIETFMKLELNCKTQHKAARFKTKRVVAAANRGRCVNQRVAIVFYRNMHCENEQMPQW